MKRKLRCEKEKADEDASDDPLCKLQSYKEMTKRDGEHLVKNVFPQRVFEMEEMINSSQFAHGISVEEELGIGVPPPGEALVINGGVVKGEHARGDSLGEGKSPEGKKRKVEASPDLSKGLPVYTFVCGTVKCNGTLKKMIEIVKPKLTRLMDEAQLVRLWIQFNIPRIEDGNNFGVQIQEEALSEASQIERDACSFLDQISRYYAARGKVVTRVAKYPHIEDYRECIRDMDEKEAITLRYIIMEIRNHYATLHDLIEKNLDRIKTPRSNNAVSMY